jgi:hypothetical protein
MDPAEETEQTPQANQVGSSEPQAVVVRKEAERDLFTWNAPARPFKRRDKQFYVTTFAIAGIVSLILLFAEGPMPPLLIISLVFLYYVLSTVEPEKIEYKITNKGIKIAGKLTSWDYLNRFWFTKKLNTDVLIIGTILIPGTIEMVINQDSKETLKKEISTFIPHDEVPTSSLDKVTEWMSSRLPANK